MISNQTSSVSFVRGAALLSDRRARPAGPAGRPRITATAAGIVLLADQSPDGGLHAEHWKKGSADTLAVERFRFKGRIPRNA